MKRWKTLKSKIIYSWHTSKLRANEVELPDGRRLEYKYIEHPGSVVVVPFFPDGNVIVIEQYRYPIRENSLEFPAGGIEKDEDEKKAAQREMREEIGYETDKLFCLGSFYPSNSGSDERVAIYLAADLIPVEKDVDRDELHEITRHKIPFSQLIDYISKGKVTDGFTTIAAFFMQQHLKKERNLE